MDVLKNYKLIYNFMFILLIYVGTMLSYNIYVQPKCNHHKYLRLKFDINPDTTIFAFDLHDVLFSKDYKSLVNSAFNAFSKGMFWYLLNPFFLFNAIKASMQNRVWEDIFYNLAENYPGLLEFELDFFNVANSCCRPIGPMIQLVKDLKKLGYKIFLLSNIGFQTYSDLKLKFPDILNLFDGVYLPSKDNNYHHKPDKRYYIGFKNYLKQSFLGNKQIIFIDDLPINLERAFQVGISGICCKNTGFIFNVLKSLSII